MSGIREVIAYSNLSYSEVLELPCDIFMLMRKNYITDKLRETEEGREYLEKCERLGTSKADRAGIKALKKRLEGGD